MLRLKYQTLCTIAFLHEYYQDGISRDFVLVPTDTTKQIMENYTLILKETRSNILIAQKTEGGIAEVAFTKPICLTFLVKLTNPSLYSVSNLSDKRQFFFTNIDKNGVYRRNLTAEDVMSAHDALMPLRPQQLNLAIPKGTIQTIELSRMELGGTFKLPALSIDIDKETIDIQLGRTGVYTMIKKPVNNKEIFYANSHLGNTINMFGIMELWFDQNFVSGLKYEVKIAARHFKWQYYLTDTISNETVSDSAPNLAIEYQRNSYDTLSPPLVQFVRKEILSIDNDSAKVIQDLATNNQTVRRVILFESDENIPVLESRAPTIKMTLGATKSLSLPVPDITNLNIRLMRIRDPEDPDYRLARAMMFFSI
jgi:hypothetical protein